MHNPCTTRRIVNVIKSGATANSAVGIESAARLMRMPRRRSIRRLNKDTIRPAPAMPIVLAFTANPMAAGVTS